MREEIRNIILSMTSLRDWMSADVAVQQIEQKLNRSNLKAEIDPVIHGLKSEGLLETEAAGSRIRRDEPDCPEVGLYNSLEQEIRSSFFRRTIGVGEEFVLQDTSMGGRGAGRLSRPDFTLAEIRTWKFHPRPSLEVFSFEVKNRAGTSVSAAYEAHAHGRMVHYCYLVCPRTTMFRDDELQLAETCRSLGVGLLLFDLTRQGDVYLVKGLKVEAFAERRATAPAEVEAHLENRFTLENAESLKRLAANT